LKQTCSLLLAFLLVFSCFYVQGKDNMITLTEKTITVTYNGDEIQFPDALPIIQNERTLVPIRAIMERARLKVDFDETTGKVTARNKDVTIQMFIDSADALVEKNGVTKHVTLEEPACIIDGRTYAPIRFIAESLDTKVNWNPYACEVVIIDTVEWKREIAEKSAMLSSMLDTPLQSMEAMSGSAAGECNFLYTVQDFVIENSPPIDINMGMSLSFSGTEVFDGNNRGAYHRIDADLSSLKSYFIQVLEADVAAKISRPYTIDVELIVDEHWNVYGKSAGILQILQDAGHEEIVEQIGDCYVKITVADLLSYILGISISNEAFLASETLWDLIETVVQSDDILYTQSVATLDSVVLLFSDLFADELVKITPKRDGTEVWSYELDSEDYRAIVEAKRDVVDGEGEEAEKKAATHTEIYFATEMTMKNNVLTKTNMELNLTRIGQLSTGEPTKLKINLKTGTTQKSFNLKQDKKITLPKNTVELKTLLPEKRLSDSGEEIIISVEQ